MIKTYKNFQQHRSKNYSYRDEKRPHIKKEVRLRVLNRFDGKCYLCGESPKRLCIDHVKPFLVSNDNSEENLMPCCFSCNNFKGIFGIEELRREISMQVKRARENSLNFRFAERFDLIIETGKSVEFYFEKVRSDSEKTCKSNT